MYTKYFDPHLTDKDTRGTIVRCLRQLVDSIEANPKNKDAQMPKAIMHSPRRLWYVEGKEEPQGSEYAGDIVIDIQIILPRRDGERIIDHKHSDD